MKLAAPERVPAVYPFVLWVIAVLATCLNGAPVRAATDEDVCGSVARVAGFALHSRTEGTSEQQVKEIIMVTLPPAEFPERAALADRVITFIYQIPDSQLVSFMPIDRSTLEKFEMGTFRRCIDDWR
jgi:hypothetical protein